MGVAASSSNTVFMKSSPEPDELGKDDSRLIRRDQRDPEIPDPGVTKLSDPHVDVSNEARVGHIQCRLDDAQGRDRHRDVRAVSRRRRPHGADTSRERDVEVALSGTDREPQLKRGPARSLSRDGRAERRRVRSRGCRSKVGIVEDPAFTITKLLGEYKKLEIVLIDDGRRSECARSG